MVVQSSIPKETGIQLVHLPPQILQRNGVNAAALVVLVGVAILADTVLALAFARSQDTAFAVFAFGILVFLFRHNCSFHVRKPKGALI